MKERMKPLYMDMASRVAQMSRAKKLQVGCLIVKDDNIISFSWNGTPAGWDNNCEDVEWCDGGGWLSPEEIIEGWPYEGTYQDSEGNDIYGRRYRLKTKPEVIHAERNALDKLVRIGGVGGSGACMFITHAPCLECSKSIYGAGITQVFYRSQYRNDDGIEFLTKCNVKVEKYEN